MKTSTFQAVLLLSAASIVAAEVNGTAGPWQVDCATILDVFVGPAENYHCGRFTVPLDYNNTAAGNATLMVTKYSAQKFPRLGSIFVNPGGPGDPGATWLGEMGGLLSNYTGGQYDIISWDPRGTGHTIPSITCLSSDSASAKFWNGTAPLSLEVKGNFTSPNGDDPDSIAFWKLLPEVDRLLGELGQLCLKTDGEALKYVGTVANVRDILLLSDILEGPGKDVNYWGFSYGTIIGSYLVNMFPDRVGRIIVDGVVNPVKWADGPSYGIWSYEITSADAVFRGFAASCAAAGPDSCAIAVKGSTAESIIAWTHSLMDAAYDYFQAGGDFGSSDIRTQIYQALYTPQTWQETARLMAEYAKALKAGPSSKRDNDHILKRLAKREDVATPYAFQAIACADAADSGNITTTDVFNEIIFASSNVSQMFGPQFGAAGFYCHKWPARAVERFAGPWNHTLKHPILVIGNEADPVTPLPGAKFVADTLGDSAILVEQDDFGHTSLAEHSDCTLAIIGNYFTNGQLPAKDEFCGTNQILFPRAGVTKQGLLVQNGGSRVEDLDDISTGLDLHNITDTSAGNSTNVDDLHRQVHDLKVDRRNLMYTTGALGIAFIFAIGALVFALVSRHKRGAAYQPPAVAVLKKEEFNGRRQSTGTLHGAGVTEYHDPYDAPTFGGSRYRD